MNMADFASLSNLFSKKTTNLNLKPIKVSSKWRVVKSKLTTPVYLKSGPGHYDFGYVDLNELIKVK